MNGTAASPPQQQPQHQHQQHWSSPPPGWRRHSGFDRPLHPLQVLVWILFCCCVIIYYSLCIPFVPDGHNPEFYSFVFIYIGLCIPGFCLFFAVTLTDPYVPLPTSVQDQTPQPAPSASADASTLPGHALATHRAPVAAAAAAVTTGIALPVVAEAGDVPAHAHAPQTTGSVPLHNTTVCQTCGAVQGPTTKHCYIDGRCCDGFDHHCVYLNLCVGKVNYGLFFAFVSNVTTLLIFQLIVTLWLLAHYQDSDYAHAVDDSGLDHPLAWLILLTCLSVLPALCLFGISTLQCFHCYLLATRQSTYGWIIRRRHIMAERQRQYEAAMQQQRYGRDGQRQPNIVLSDKQRAEQAEWLKQRASRADTRGGTQWSHQQQQEQQQQQQVELHERQAIERQVLSSGSSNVPPEGAMQQLAEQQPNPEHASSADGVVDVTAPSTVAVSTSERAVV